MTGVRKTGKKGKSKGTGAQRRANRKAEAKFSDAVMKRGEVETALDMPKSDLIPPIQTNLVPLLNKINGVRGVIKDEKFDAILQNTAILASGFCKDHDVLIKMLGALQDMPESQRDVTEYLKQQDSSFPKLFPHSDHIASVLRANNTVMNNNKKFNIFTYALCTKLVLPFLSSVEKAFGDQKENIQKMALYRASVEALMKKIPKKDLEDLDSKESQSLLTVSDLPSERIAQFMNLYFEPLDTELNSEIVAVNREKAKQDFASMIQKYDVKSPEEAETKTVTEVASSVQDQMQEPSRTFGAKIENMCQDVNNMMDMLTDLRDGSDGKKDISPYIENQKYPMTQQVASYLEGNKAYKDNPALRDSFISAVCSDIIFPVIGDAFDYEEEVLKIDTHSTLLQSAESKYDTLYTEVEYISDDIDHLSHLGPHDTAINFVKRLKEQYVKPLREELTAEETAAQNAAKLLDDIDEEAAIEAQKLSKAQAKKKRANEKRKEAKAQKRQALEMQAAREAFKDIAIEAAEEATQKRDTKQNNAATKIQALARGNKGRKEFEQQKPFLEMRRENLKMHRKNRIMKAALGNSELYRERLLQWVDANDHLRKLLKEVHGDNDILRDKNTQLEEQHRVLEKFVRKFTFFVPEGYGADTKGTKKQSLLSANAPEFVPSAAGTSEYA